MKAALLATSALVALGLLAACKGGAGALPGLSTTQDPAPKTNEAVARTGESSPVTNESVARTGEAAPGNDDTSVGPSGGGGGFSCHGTYQCTTTGTGSTRTSTIVLNGSAGHCTSEGSSINPDGTITADGQVVAQWSGGDSGFSFTAQDTETDTDDGKTTTTVIDVSVSCSKISDSTTPVAGDDDDDTTIEVDAGTR